MLNRDELRTSPPTAVALGVGAEVTVGSAVPQNHRRFIYRIRYISQFAGPNALRLGKQENGGVTVPVDVIQTVVLDEMVTDPDELHEDSAPLYIIDGPPGQAPVLPALNSLVRAYTDAGAGILTYWYIDAPA